MGWAGKSGQQKITLRVKTVGMGPIYVKASPLRGNCGGPYKKKKKKKHLTLYV
jgi:hypothetical protein